MKHFSTRPYPIRLQEEMYAEVQKAGRRLGLCGSAVIRLAIALQLDAISKGNITIQLPEKN